MPFDSIVAFETKPDLTKPTLEGLAYLARHPEEWPQNFTFDFGHFLVDQAPECGTVGCVGGLAWKVWRKESPGWTIDAAMMDLLNIPAQAVYEIFMRGCLQPNRKISAAHVADRIDDYLAGRPIRD